MDRGIYIRCRNATWEAKLRAGGDYERSRFIEVIGSEAVCKVLREQNCGGDEGVDGLREVVTFDTQREMFTIDNFTVVIDTTGLLFSYPVADGVARLIVPHCVGEVEICEEVEGDDRDKEVLGRAMEKKIERFMQEYEWAFPRAEAGRKVHGKLGAWFKWDRMFGKMVGREMEEK